MKETKNIHVDKEEMSRMKEGKDERDDSMNLYSIIRMMVVKKKKEIKDIK